MEEYYDKINELVLDLLLPARAEKKINKKAFNKFCEILNELENKLKGEEYVPKKVIGIIYFISNSLSTEAMYCKYYDEVFIAAGKVEDMLGKILGAPYC